MNRAVIYCRVSTEEQAEKGTSLETQEAKCRLQAELRDAEIVAVCIDEGVSGALYDTRPQIQNALRLIEAKQANILLTYRIDRLGRKARIVLDIAERIDRAGGMILTCDGMEYGGSPTGRLMLTQLSAFAEFERETIRERSMAGKKRKAEMNQQPNRSIHPFGFHIVQKKDVQTGAYPADMIGQYVPIPEEARVVREIYARFNGGESLRKIVEWLEASGIKTKTGGEIWQRATVRLLLMQPCHKGEPISHRYHVQRDETRQKCGYKTLDIKHLRPENEQIKLTCEPIVSAQVWERCQELLQQNRQTKSGRPDRVYTLTGMMRCPKCRRSMGANLSQGARIYYQCREGRMSSKRCDIKQYRGEPIEAMVIEAIRYCARQPELFAQALRAYDQQTQATQGNPETVERLRKELAEIERQEDATAKAQVQAITNGRSTAVYDRLLADLDTKRRALKARLVELESQIVPTVPKTDFEKVAEVLERMDEALTAAAVDTAEKRSILSSVIEAVYPTEEGCQIELRKSLTVYQTLAGYQSALGTMVARFSFS